MFKFIRYITLLFIILIQTLQLKAEQTDKPQINFSGYIDTYFANDNEKMINDTSTRYRSFSYANARKNRFSINTAQITAKILFSDFVRSNITLHTGDLHKTAYSSNLNDMIQQANAGIKIYDNFWIDAGYFLTHIGAEGLLPKDNWLSIHSLVTFYEPFYQSGVRFSYESEKFNVQFHILNGSGIFDENNFNKTFGWFIGYTPNANFNISYAGEVGNEDTLINGKNRLHTFQNLVAQFNLLKNLSLKTQFDLGTKSNMNYTFDAYNPEIGYFYGFTVQAHYQFLEKIAATLRWAYIDNKNSIYDIRTAPPVIGSEFTFGFEYKPHQSSFIRIEARNIGLDENYFYEGGNKYNKSRMEFIMNMGVWID
jgi:hypothetical protein